MKDNLFTLENDEKVESNIKMTVCIIIRCLKYQIISLFIFVNNNNINNRCYNTFWKIKYF